MTSLQEDQRVKARFTPTLNTQTMKRKVMEMENISRASMSQTLN